MFEAIVLAVILVGSNAVNAASHEGKLPEAAPACKFVQVKAENGNYYFNRLAGDNAKNCVVK